MPESLGLSRRQALVKRSFDLVLAGTALLLLWPFIVLAFLVSWLDTGANGLFIQERIGRWGKPFNLIKIRTMRVTAGESTTVTTADDPRITWTGRLMRRIKLDELPQLINVLLGDMSFVGPRPDVAGFADCLRGDDRIILSMRPGITGPATLKYRNEEELLAAQEDPERFNAQVIYPDKVRLNRIYAENWTLRGDLELLARTLFPLRSC